MSVSKTHVSLKSGIARRKAVVQRAVEQLEDRRMMSATLALVNPDGLPASNRLIFNYVQNPDATVPNVIHDQQTLQISDTGTTPLVISSMAINGPWAFIGAPTGGYTNVTVNPGTPLTVTLAFTQRSLPAHSYNETNFTTQPNGGAAITGALTINSNDSAAPSKIVTLAGYWQNLSNSNEEPSLQTTVNLLGGYQTVINATPIPDLTESNGVQLYGSEVAAASWEPAVPTQPVSLQQLGAFRTEGNNASLYWYTASAQQSHLLFTDAANQGQTYLPTLSAGGLAVSSFTPTGAFGFRVDNEYSTDSINVAAGNTGGGGHHFRFFPLVDSSGNTAANTYIVTMDYGTIQTENFDFNDNMFVVSNIRPSGTPETPVGLTATSGATPMLSWTPDSYSPVAYNVYSSASLNGTYNKLTPTPITAATYTDTANTGTPVYYKVTAIDTTQVPPAESFPATATSNVGPITTADNFSTYKGVGFTFNPLINDADVTGTLDPTSVLTAAPNHGGTATVDTTTGLITYTPAVNFTGTETFTYTVADSNHARSVPTTVTVVVNAPLPVAPVANNLVVTDLANTPTQINVLSVDNPTSTFNVGSIVITTAPTAGAVTVNGDGTVTYTPGRNFVGGDEFRYTVADTNTAVSNVAIVDINVGTEISSVKGAIHVVAYRDENGTPVTVTLNRGVADVYFDGTGTVVSSLRGVTTIAGSGIFAREVTLSGTNIGSVLRMVGAKGAQFNLAGINDAGTLGAVVAPGANLRSTGSTSLLASSLLVGTLGPLAAQVATTTPAAGVINLGGVRSISLRTSSAGKFILGSSGVTSTSVNVSGTVTDTAFTSSVPISTLHAKAWVKSATDIQLVTAPSIANLSITGEFDPDLTLNSTGRTSALGTAHIGGAVAIGNWSVTGNARSVYVGSVKPSWGGITVSAALGSMFVASGGMASDVTAGTIGNLRVAGALSGNVTTVGNLNSLIAAQLVGSVVDVGSTALNVANASLANLGTSRLGSVRITSRLPNTFSDSSIIADVIGSAVTGQVNAVGTNEGIATHSIRTLVVGLDNGVVHIPAADLLSNSALAGYLSGKGLTLGNFVIDIL